MKHRTQLYLDDGQYRWLKRQARQHGSVAAVVRDMIDAARQSRPDQQADPLINFLLEEPPAQGRGDTSVGTLDQDLYG
jgi:hypothetical protein